MKLDELYSLKLAIDTKNDSYYYKDINEAIIEMMNELIELKENELIEYKKEYEKSINAIENSLELIDSIIYEYECNNRKQIKVTQMEAHFNEISDILGSVL